MQSIDQSCKVQLLIRDDLLYPLNQYITCEDDDNVDPRILFDRWATRSSRTHNNWMIHYFVWDKFNWSDSSVSKCYLLKFIDQYISRRGDSLALYVKHLNIPKIELYGSLLNHSNITEYIEL